MPAFSPVARDESSSPSATRAPCTLSPEAARAPGSPIAARWIVVSAVARSRAVVTTSETAGGERGTSAVPTR
jgi:hypothetical protein